MSDSASTADLTQLAAGERWYVVITQSGKENVAAANLTNQGFRNFFPQLTTTYRHARKVSTRLAPVFPQYLFAVLDPAKSRWRAVNGTLGVRHFISNEVGPVPVRVGVVETLLKSADKNRILTFSSPSLKAGDRVKLVAGPFAEAFGNLQSLDASGRVRLLLDIMGGTISATADVSVIAPATEDR